MQKRIISLLIVCVMLTITGCNLGQKSQNESTATEIKEDLTSKVSKMSFNKKYDFFSKRYPNSKILVWLDESYHDYELDLNDYLSEKGYEYVVCFRSLGDEIKLDENGEETNTTMESALELIKNKEKIDVLGWVSLSFGKDIPSQENNLIKQGYYEPLNKYLENKKYSEYVKLMPEKYWYSYSRNGNIYGLDVDYSALSYDYGYEIDNQIFEKCNLKPEDFQKPLDKLEPILKKVREASGANINLVVNSFTSEYYNVSYVDDGLGIVNKKVVNVFEQPELTEYYSLVDSLGNKGLATINQIIPNDGIRNIETTINKVTNGKTISNNLKNTTNVFYQQNGYIRHGCMSAGVYSGSKNKDLAFDLLINLFYNKEMNNIITYGIEGKNYEVVDGNVEMKDNDSLKSINNITYESGNTTYSVDTFYNNEMISLPCKKYDIYNIDYYKAYDNAKYLDGYNFDFDASPVKDEYLQVVDIIQNMQVKGDVVSYMKRFNQKLYDTGLQDVIDEANRQLDEFYKDKSSN